MKISSFITAQAIVKNDDEQTIKVIRPFGILELPGTPTYFSFSMSLGLCDLTMSDDGIIIQMFSPIGEEIVKINEQFPFIDRVKVGEKMNFVLSVSLNNVYFSEDGFYQITIRDSKNVLLSEFAIQVEVQHKENINYKQLN